MAERPRYSTNMKQFHEALEKAYRIVALCGAGMSAASGLPTFRGAGGIWRNFDAVSLATPEAFEHNPSLVWQFYNYRRHMALKAKPNPAHFALAELAKRNNKFLCLTQNVDVLGLSPRAGHPQGSLRLLHGSLFDLKCSGFYCDYVQKNNYIDPICPALAIPKSAPEPILGHDGAAAGEALAAAMKGGTELDISNANVEIRQIPPEELPRCPKCHNLLRPGVVWFGESLPTDVLDSIDKYIEDSGTIDLILVIGTSARVWPAAGYIDEARRKRARVAIINVEEEDLPNPLTERDWFFKGDAGVLIPQLLKPVIGDKSNWQSSSSSSGPDITFMVNASNS